MNETSLRHKLWPYLFASVLCCVFLLGGSIALICMGSQMWAMSTLLFPLAVVVISCMSAWNLKRIIWQIPVLLLALTALGGGLWAWVVPDSVSVSAAFWDLMAAFAPAGVYSLILVVFWGITSKTCSESAWGYYLLMAMVLVFLMMLGSFVLSPVGMVLALALLALLAVAAWFHFRSEGRAGFAPAVWAAVCMLPSAVYDLALSAAGSAEAGSPAVSAVLLVIAALVPAATAWMFRARSR